MKILNIEDFFHPSAGYQLNVLSKYLVGMGHDIRILTSELKNVPKTLTSFFGDGDIKSLDADFEKKYKVKIERIPTKRFISNRAQFDSIIFKSIELNNPDIIFVHGNTTLIAMQVLLKLSKINKPVVMDCHMLEMASKNRFKQVFELFYRLFFTPIIIKNNIVIIRTQDDLYLQKCLNIPIKQCPYISFGTDTKLFCEDNTIKSEFRKKNNISEDEFVFLYAGKLDESKGGLFLSEALMEKIDTKRNIVFLIIGNANGEDGKLIEENLLKSKNRVLRVETQKYEDLAKYYKMADAGMFPKQCSLSFFDMQACGLPILFEDNSINIERSKYDNAITFKSDNVDDFRDKIKYLVDMPTEKFNIMKKNSICVVNDKYNYNDIAKKYFVVIQKCYNDFYGI